jgi:hypothetical protein
LADNKLDVTAYTPTDLSNYYTKSETSGATELTTALGAKLDATAYTPTDLSNYYTKSETSGATEISTALGEKISSGDVVTEITSSNSASTAPVSVKIVAENELVISTALNDLEANKLDVSAYTPTDLSNYYTKSQTSGASELSTALGGKSDTGHTHDASGVTAMTGYQIAASGASVLTTDSLLITIGKLEKRIYELEQENETVAAALVELNTKIGDIETLLQQI